MYTYTYSYQSDSTRETIGRVKATGLYEAREQIAITKHLSVDDVDLLFVIEREDGHEKQIRTIVD